MSSFLKYFVSFFSLFFLFFASSSPAEIVGIGTPSTVAEFDKLWELARIPQPSEVGGWYSCRSVMTEFSLLFNSDLVGSKGPGEKGFKIVLPSVDRAYEKLSDQYVQEAIADLQMETSSEWHNAYVVDGALASRRTNDFQNEIRIRILNRQILVKYVSTGGEGPYGTVLSRAYSTARVHD